MKKRKTEMKENPMRESETWIEANIFTFPSSFHFFTPSSFIHPLFLSSLLSQHLLQWPVSRSSYFWEEKREREAGKEGEMWWGETGIKICEGKKVSREDSNQTCSSNAPLIRINCAPCYRHESIKIYVLQFLIRTSMLKVCRYCLSNVLFE